MAKIIIATGNISKFLGAKEKLKPYKINIIMRNLNIIEPQEENIEKVAMYKVNAAYEIVKSPVIVSDTGWSIPGLNGFPGPFMHYISDWFSGSDLARLLEGVENRTVLMQNVASFRNDAGIKIFTSIRKGFLLDKPTGKGVAIDQLASFRSDGKSIAECNESNINRYDYEITDSIWTQFGTWYNQKHR